MPNCTPSNISHFPLDDTQPGRLAASIVTTDQVKRATALADDLRHVLRRHKARIDWVMDVEGRVKITVIIDSPQAGTIAARLSNWFHRIWKF